MLISQLPPGLKELAEKRRYSETVNSLARAFNYGCTPEGRDFWREVYFGNFSVYYGCKVVNCKPKQLRLEVGKTYEDRNGQLVLIDITQTGFIKTPFGSSKCFQSYRPDGRYLPAGTDHEYDLIREVK